MSYRRSKPRSDRTRLTGPLFRQIFPRIDWGRPWPIFEGIAKSSSPCTRGEKSAHCWAAALEWWLKVTPNRSQLSKDELIGLYAKKYGDGSLDPLTEFPTVKSENGMESQNIGGSSFTAEYVYNKLSLGHLFVAYERPGSSFGHCIVVYGIDNGTVNFMDPARGMHWYRRVSYFSDAKMTVAWPQAVATAP
jgi:Papain-like cysteine protease AvrRpt2